MTWRLKCDYCLNPSSKISQLCQWVEDGMSLPRTNCHSRYLVHVPLVGTNALSFRDCAFAPPCLDLHPILSLSSHSALLPTRAKEALLCCFQTPRCNKGLLILHAHSVSEEGTWQWRPGAREGSREQKERLKHKSLPRLRGHRRGCLPRALARGGAGRQGVLVSTMAVTRPVSGGSTAAGGSRIPERRGRLCDSAL